MLAQLSTLKLRLAITAADYDTILTNALTAISVRFDNECNRTFTRTTGALHEFDASDVEITPPCYPIESVTKFELKENETDGWIEQTDVDYLIRKSCVISLRFRSQPSTLNPQPAEVDKPHDTHQLSYRHPDKHEIIPAFVGRDVRT